MSIVLGTSLDNGLAAPLATRPAVQRATSVTSLSIGQYLIRRLSDYGIRHVFGLPGDYVLAFYSMLEHSPLDLVNCTREDCAGFAADAYARVNGMGALCVTYGVGGLSVANSVAGAFADGRTPRAAVDRALAAQIFSNTSSCVRHSRTRWCSRGSFTRSPCPGAPEMSTTGLFSA